MSDVHVIKDVKKELRIFCYNISVLHRKQYSVIRRSIYVSPPMIMATSRLF